MDPEDLEIKDSRDSLVAQETLADKETRDPLGLMVEMALRARRGNKASLELPEGLELLVSTGDLAEPDPQETLASLDLQELLADLEDLEPLVDLAFLGARATQDLWASKVAPGALAVVDPQVRLEHREYQEAQETEEGRDSTAVLELRDLQDSLVPQEAQELPVDPDL